MVSSLTKLNKELRIVFSKSDNYIFEPIVINDRNIEKGLGFDHFKQPQQWNTHIERICKKIASRLYFLRQLIKRAK